MQDQQNFEKIIAAAKKANPQKPFRAFLGVKVYPTTDADGYVTSVTVWERSGDEKDIMPLSDQQEKELIDTLNLRTLVSISMAV